MGARVPVVLAGAAVVLAACGSAHPRATSARSATRAVRQTTTTAPAAPRSPGGQAPTSSGAGGSSGTAGGAHAGTGGGSSPDVAAGPTPAQPGTYEYSQSGSFKAGLSSQSVPAQGTVAVDLPSAQSAGSWTQVWHSYVDPSQPPSDTTFVISPSGIAIESEVIRMSGVTFTCTFSPPIEVISWPPAVGHQFAGTGQCGSFTAQVSGSVTGTQPTSLDGSAVTAYVIETHVSTTGSVSSTSTETDWFDPALGLDLYQDTNENGSYGGIAFSSQLTRKLVSGHPH